MTDQILKTPLIVALAALLLWVAALYRTGVRGQGGQAQPVVAVALGDTFVRLTLVARMPTTPPETTSS